MPEQKPAIGRIVHYCLEALYRGNNHRAPFAPAMIVGVNADDDSVNLQVFLNGPAAPLFVKGAKAGVHVDGTLPAAEPGQWVWPPRT